MRYYNAHKPQSEKTSCTSLEQVAQSFFEVGVINRATVSALARYCLYAHQSMCGLSPGSYSKTAPSTAQLELMK